MRISFSISYRDLQIGRELGRGGFGVVHQGTWQQHTPVAIKQLLNPRMSAEALREFQQEATVMASIHHPNVVPLYGICTEPGHYSMVMEYMPKGSLYGVLHDPAEVLQWPTRWQIAMDMCRGVDHLHRRTPLILHQDLKSLNVVLRASMQAAVTDFGLAKVKTEASTSTMHRGMGTLQWMAPELFSLRPRYSRPSDMYSCGIILWALATRQTPYAGVDPVTIRESVKAGRREAIPGPCPPTFAALIGRCWAQRAADRLTADQVVQELERHQAEARMPGLR